MKNRKTIGVIVITYNGQEFIYKQLQSILCQSLKADIVYIFDDCSQDKTVEIIESFLRVKQLPWCFVQNSKNLGWCHNAYKALKACKTDYVLWSDQDDIWYPNKIEELVNAAISDERNMLVYSGWIYIDHNENKIPTQLKFNHPNQKYKIIQPGKLPYHIPPLLGCAMCIKQDVINFIEPKLFDTKLYCSTDSIVYYTAQALGRVVYINEPLLFRRIHKNNATISESTMRHKLKKECDQMEEEYDILKQQYQMLTTMIKSFRNRNIDLNHMITAVNEKRYLECRLNYLSGNSSIVSYMFYGIKACKIRDLLYILIKDRRFTKYIKNKTGSSRN